MVINEGELTVINETKPYVSSLQILASNNAIKRNRPGTSAKDFNNWNDEALDEMESTLAVQQVGFIRRYRENEMFFLYY